MNSGDSTEKELATKRARTLRSPSPRLAIAMHSANNKQTFLVVVG